MFALLCWLGHAGILWLNVAESVQTGKCPPARAQPVVLKGAKPCKFYDWSQDRLVEGPNTAGCQAAVAATPCPSTQLYAPGGSEVIPDQCFGKKGERDFVHFTPPCPSSGQDASTNVTVECTVTRRRSLCQTDGAPCEPGKWVCSPAHQMLGCLTLPCQCMQHCRQRRGVSTP